MFFPSFLHFGENTTANKSNMLMTVRSAVKYIHLHAEFITFHAPQHNVTINLTKLKWQLSYVQFNPLKCMKICTGHESTREIQNGKFIFLLCNRPTTGWRWLRIGTGGRLLWVR
jgi:hypothetical protein